MPQLFCATLLQSATSIIHYPLKDMEQCLECGGPFAGDSLRPTLIIPCSHFLHERCFDFIRKVGTLSDQAMCCPCGAIVMKGRPLFLAVDSKPSTDDVQRLVHLQRKLLHKLQQCNRSKHMYHTIKDECARIHTELSQLNIISREVVVPAQNTFDSTVMDEHTLMSYVLDSRTALDEEVEKLASLERGRAALFLCGIPFSAPVLEKGDTPRIHRCARVEIDVDRFEHIDVDAELSAGDDVVCLSSPPTMSLRPWATNGCCPPMGRSFQRSLRDIPRKEERLFQSDLPGTSHPIHILPGEK